MLLFPDRSFLIHIKADEAQDGERLAQHLAGQPEARLKQLAVYGGDKPAAVLHQKLPLLRVISMAALKQAPAIICRYRLDRVRSRILQEYRTACPA